MNNPKADNKANLFTGIAVLVLIALVLGYIGIKQLMKLPQEKPRTYVAYFENSGGLREGDRVRIQGRAAGLVKNVDVVNHKGRTVSRVEFEITPGTGSPWLKEMERVGGIPSDSTISVRTPSMLGRPLLVISIGKNDEKPIAEGGEWVNTRSANESDQLTQWGEDIDRAKSQIKSFIEFFDDREQFDKLNENLTDIADGLEEADKAIGRFEGRGTEFDSMLTKAREGMDEAREGLGDPDDAMGKGLGEMVGKVGKTATQFDRIGENLARAMEEVARIKGTLSGAVSSADESQLEKLGLELRRLSTRLRAGMEIAKQDPKQFGDMPNWRRSRPYFHGGPPARGTSIDDPPSPAPSEKIGVPKGPAVPKREEK